ncbi:MAG: aminotransferase class I/II-fold pyridoxal phosphate-dependent enzyme [Crocinitomicaceae bacterium]
MLEQLKCKSSGTLLDVIEVINNNAKGVAFIINDDDTFGGIMTDGDIRRLLLDGFDLSSQIGNNSNQNCTIAYEGESFQKMLKKTNEKVTILPILNADRQLIDFFQYQNKVYVPVAAPNLKGNEFKYLVDAFMSTWISSSGKYINQFEEQFSAFCDCKYGVAVSNGTVAIHLALEALGIGNSDEVIVPDLTFAATINTVFHSNATPVIVDVLEDSWCIDPDEIEKAITPKTKAIIPVHIYGQVCNMDAIMALAKKHKLFVIEDCAEAHGATYKGRKVGSFGDISTFSFFGNKIITTGEGGMCVTNNEASNNRMRVLRDHGMSKEKRYWHDEVGYNYRMTNLQAAIGVGQLERINEILDFRRSIENDYIDLLKDFDFIQFQPHFKNSKRVTWLVSALINNGKRNELMELMKEGKIDVRPFFYPLGDMAPYKEHVFSNKISRHLSEQGINFPTAQHLNPMLKDRIKLIFESLK